MKRVGKSNARSEGRAGLFSIDTPQKKIILFSSPTYLQNQFAERLTITPTHLEVSITKRTSVLAISRKFYVVYRTKKRHGAANFLFTIQENRVLVKEEKIKMSPFYVEGDKGIWQKKTHTASGDFTYLSSV